MTVKEIDEQIRKLQNQRYKLREQEIEEFKKRAVKNIGRCFIIDGVYVKVIGIPKETYTRTGIEMNEYQYTGLFLYGGYVPFKVDNIFSGNWGEGNLVFRTAVKEISAEEFNQEFEKHLKNFSNKVLGDKE